MSELLESLRPRKRLTVMEAVRQAGVDVRPWRHKKGGIVKHPSANPKYCYEWAFGGGGEPIALFLWFDSLQDENGNIVWRGNLRQLEASLRELRLDSSKAIEQRARSIEQELRAGRFDKLVREAFEQRSPIRAVLLEGDQQEKVKLGNARASVKFRRLDKQSWHVHQYLVSTGETVLVRGDPGGYIAADAKPLVNRSALDDLNDEPAGTELPAVLQKTSPTYARDDSVRSWVIDKAKGVCEYCGKRGFMKPDGTYYVEAHHIISLSKQGPDKVENVIALCANHHREAHYGADRVELERKMIARVRRRNKARE